MAVAVHTDMSTPALAKFGSDQLRKDFLAPAIAGDVVTCVAVSEPGGGSDVAACKTSAVRKGYSSLTYRLNLIISTSKKH